MLRCLAGSLLLLCLAIQSAATVDEAVTPVSAHPRILRGFVVDNTCFTDSGNQDERETCLVFTSLLSARPKKSAAFPKTETGGTKFRIAYKQLWSLYDGIVPQGNIGAYRFEDFLKGRLVTGINPPPGYNEPFMQWFSSSVNIARRNVFARYQLHYDYLPLSADSLRLFLVINPPLSALPSKAVGQSTRYGPFRKLPEKDHQWSFSTAKYQAKWISEKTNTDGTIWDIGWHEGSWSDEEVLEVAFKEPFHVFSKKNDYYFVTDSGKLFHSPPLHGGQKGPRKVFAFDGDFPFKVTHVIVDNDKNRTYAVAKRELKKGEKEPWFVMFEFKGDGLSPSTINHFQSKDLKATNLQEPLKSVWQFARFPGSDGVKR